MPLELGRLSRCQVPMQLEGDEIVLQAGRSFVTPQIVLARREEGRVGFEEAAVPEPGDPTGTAG